MFVITLFELLPDIYFKRNKKKHFLTFIIFLLFYLIKKNSQQYKNSSKKKKLTLASASKIKFGRFWVDSINEYLSTYRRYVSVFSVVVTISYSSTTHTMPWINYYQSLCIIVDE